MDSKAEIASDNSDRPGISRKPEAGPKIRATGSPTYRMRWSAKRNVWKDHNRFRSAVHRGNERNGKKVDSAVKFGTCIHIWRQVTLDDPEPKSPQGAEGRGGDWRQLCETVLRPDILPIKGAAGHLPPCSPSDRCACPHRFIAYRKGNGSTQSDLTRGYGSSKSAQPFCGASIECADRISRCNGVGCRSGCC